MGESHEKRSIRGAPGGSLDERPPPGVVVVVVEAVVRSLLWEWSQGLRV